MKTLVVNFFAGPGVGKSSIMANCFAKLKWQGYNCEMAPEYAKEKVWENSLSVLTDQFYVSAKQYHIIKRLEGKVEIILTDSPLLLGLIYGNKEPKEFKDMLVTYFNTFNNLNIFLYRQKKYNPLGRLQTEEKAKIIDEKIKEIVNIYCKPNVKIEALESNVDKIVEKIENELKILNKKYDD